MMQARMSTDSAALVESIALRVEAAGLAAPAIAFLEMNRPLGFLGSQALLMAQPLLSLVLSGTEDLAALLEDRSGMDLLIRRLERGPTG
jgi:hypothetical protein